MKLSPTDSIGVMYETFDVIGSKLATYDRRINTLEEENKSMRREIADCHIIIVESAKNIGKELTKLILEELDKSKRARVEEESEGNKRARVEE